MFLVIKKNRQYGSFIFIFKFGYVYKSKPQKKCYFNKTADIEHEIKINQSTIKDINDIKGEKNTLYTSEPTNNNLPDESIFIYRVIDVINYLTLNPPKQKNSDLLIDYMSIVPVCSNFIIKNVTYDSGVTISSVCNIYHHKFTRSSTSIGKMMNIVQLTRDCKIGFDYDTAISLGLKKQF